MYYTNGHFRKYSNIFWYTHSQSNHNFFVTRKPPIYSRRKTYSVSSKQRTTSCGFASKHAEQSGSSAVGRTLIRST